MLSPAFLCQDPKPIRHRGLVAHMLTMAALKIGHPITIFIEMISNNGLMHPRTSLRSLLWTFSRYARLARMLTRTEEYA